MSDDQQETKPQDDPVDPIEIKDNWFWMRGSNGNASVSTTLVTIAFILTSLAYVTSMFDITVGPVRFKNFDVAACSVYLTPLLALYFGRRWTEAKKGS